MRIRVCVAVALLLAACGGATDRAALSGETTTTTDTATTTTTTPPCSQPPPFRATWVPDGWDIELDGCRWHGASGDASVDAAPGRVEVTGGRTITVLGDPATIGDGEVALVADGAPWGLVGDGIAEDELERLAVGLRPETFRSDVVRPEVAAPVPDGRHAAKIVAVDASHVSLDFVGWYTGDAANAEATRRGFEDVPVPNDYIAPNDDPAVVDLPLDPDVVVTSVWADYGTPPCELCPRPLSLDRLVAIFREPGDWPTVGLAYDPWWVTVREGAVMRLDEQYVP